MLTEIEKLNHEIKLLEKESHDLQNKHVWGDWENWRELVTIEIKIIDIQKKVLEIERIELIEALIEYESY